MLAASAVFVTASGWTPSGENVISEDFVTEPPAGHVEVPAQPGAVVDVLVAAAGVREGLLLPIRDQTSL